MITTTESETLYDRACQSLAMGVSTAFRKNVTPVPMYIERGEGPRFFDVDGNELVDYGLAWGPLILGNNHPTLTKAITDQMAKGYTYGVQHRGEIELAETMVSKLPGVERVIFSNTGTEAVQAALRIARGYTGRDKFIKFEGHYHGWLNNVLVSNHPGPDQLGQTVPDVGGQPQAEYMLTLTCPWNDLDALRAMFEANKGEIAAVIGEPINVNCGSCLPDEGFLQGLIDLCKEYGALSIFDEVITGFRIALGGAREYFNLTPDLSTYAKAMAGGFSMAGVGGKAEVFEALTDGRTSHFGTYNGNPICTAAAKATIDVLSEPGIFDCMHAHGLAIREAIEAAAKDNGVMLVTSGVGTAFHVHFGLTEKPKSWRDVMKADGDIGNRFRAEMLNHGVYNLPGGRWYVGAAHTDKELETVIPAIQASMKAISG